MSESADALGLLTLTELRLFLREPVTVLFTLALPLMVLYVLNGVFGQEQGGGDQGEFVVYRGFDAPDWYTPAYVAMAVAGLDDARLYAGSWSERSGDPSRPVATGDDP